MPLTSALDFDDWIRALGPLVAAAEIRRYEAQTWLVVWADALAVELDYEADAGKVVLTAAVGRPPVGQEADLHRRLLVAGAEQPATRTRRLGLDGEGEINLIEDVPVAGLSQDKLAQRLRTFASDARELREGLSVEFTQVDDRPPPEAYFIRI
jgi:hypothetical protein